MNWPGYAVAQLRLSQRVHWKSLGIALTGTVVPLGLGLFMPWELRRAPAIAGAPAVTFVFTGFLAFSLFFTMYSLVNTVTSRRDALIYKRLRASAAPDSAIFVGEGMSAVLPNLGVAVVLMVVGVLALGVGRPANVALLVVGLLLGSVMFALLAVGISGVLPRADTSMWILTPFMVLLMFCSGVYAPLSSLPAAVRPVAAYLPMSPLVSVLRTAYLGRNFATYDAITQGTPATGVGFLDAFRVSLGPICIMIAWTTVGLGLARKLFRWDPKRPG